jgi:hypothetical protein
VPVVVITRLRLKDPDLLNDFFTAAVATLEQAKASDGNLAADVLADANSAWWTATAWRDRAAMQGFVGTEPHLGTMINIDTWCDEATFVDWNQDSAELPGWQASWQRLVADGQMAELTDATPENSTRAFPAPVEAPAA